MSSLDIRRFLNNFTQNYHQQTFSAKTAFAAENQLAQNTLAKSVTQNTTAQTTAQTTSQTISGNLQLNALQNMDRAVYAKEVLQFPKNLNEFVYMIQRGMTQTQFNQMFANQLLAQRNTLSQLQAQILAQLQGLNVSTAKEMVNIQLASQIQPALRSLEILSGGMIKLNDISLLLQQNGKEGLTKLIMSMTEASKSGITDLTQMKEMAKLINASISIASENNPQKTLKLLLMLYLPWLPLEDCVGFDLEIQSKNDTEDETDSILTIRITTMNFGVVSVTLILETSNSVDVSIECSKEFPKHELQLRIEGEQKFYAMESVVKFETNEKAAPQGAENQKTSINMSQITEINPYMLLMAHTIIKHVIEIDNNKTLGIDSHIDNV